MRNRGDYSLPWMLILRWFKRQGHRLDVAQRIAVNSMPWKTAGAECNQPWRTAVVKLSDRVNVEWLEPKAIADAHRGGRLGTLAVAIVTSLNGKPLIVISMYAPWEKFHAAAKSGQIYADASVHRVISDPTTFIGHTHRHRIIAAGDLWRGARGLRLRGSR